MRNYKNKLLNILIGLTATILALIILQNFLLPDFFSDTPLQVGKQISIPDVNLSNNNKTVLLLLSKNCNFCAESAGFYNRLISETKGKDIKIVAVFPQEVEESKKFLDDLGVNNIEIIQYKLDLLGVRGTPTILVVDNNGKILDIWLGRVSSEKETKIIGNMLR